MSRIRVLLCLAVLASVLYKPVDAQALKTLVPLYMGPTVSSINVCNQTDWVSVGNAGAKAMGIVNVNSGPGNATDAVYTSCLRNLSSRGVELVGYVRTKITTLSGGVYTQTGLRNMTEIETDIKRWKQFYGTFLKGIFVDEVIGRGDSITRFGSDEIVFYQTIISKVKNNTIGNSTWKAVGNPGGVSYAQLSNSSLPNSFNLTVIFERPLVGLNSPGGNGWNQATGVANCGVNLWTQAQGFFPAGPYCPYVPNWDAIEPTKSLIDAGSMKAAVLLYNCGALNSAQITTVLTVARTNKIAYVYMSSLPLNPNPWANLPTWFSTFVSLL